MRKNSKILIILITLLIGLNSCKDWLYIAPEDGVVRQQYWQTKEDVRLAVYGVYASMIDPALVTKLFLWGELRADMVQATSTTPLDYSNILNGNILPNNNVCKWDLFYKTINLCNVVLQYAPGVKDLDPTFSDAELNAYKAEVLGIRSLMYFYLVRTFGEVPLVLDATLDDTKSFSIPKSDQQTILRQIITDLENAKAMAVPDYETVSQNKGRFNKYNVEALLADVYLWNEQYDNCVLNCQDIIQSNSFGIVDTTNSSNWFSDVFISGNSYSESVLELQTNSNVLTTLNVASPWYTMFTQTQLKINGLVSDFFPISPEALKPDIRGNYASFNLDLYKIWKYTGANTTAEWVSTRYSHWYFYRYSDVMLMCAEAMTQRYKESAQFGTADSTQAKADTSTARQYINEIRFKRFADPSAAKSPTTKTDWAKYILDERAREFTYEGKRWFDVLRNAKRNNYANIDILINMITRGAPAAAQQSLITKARDTRSHYLPIFQTELTTNKLLTQNEFYNN